MFSIGMTEMMIIGGIALVVIGPEKFPDFAKVVMRTIRDVRSYVDEAKTEITKELAPVKKEFAELSRIKPEEYLDSLVGDDASGGDGDAGGDDKDDNDVDDLKSEHEMYGEELYEYEDEMDEAVETATAEPEKTDETLDLNREDEGLLNYETGSETPYGSADSPTIEPHADDSPTVEPETAVQDDGVQDDGEGIGGTQQGGDD